MSGKTWDLKAKHRKLLYLCFVLPKCSYGEEIYSQAPNSYFNSLDTIQNKALKLISKNLKKTNTEILHIINQIDPLPIRRIKKQLNLMTRFKQNLTNPARNIFQKTNPTFSQNLNRLGHKQKKLHRQHTKTQRNLQY